MKIFFTHSVANWFYLHGLFLVTAFSIINQTRQSWTGDSHENFPLWLLEWSSNGLKNFLKGLRDVKEGGIRARKVAQMWKCWDWAWRNQAQECRSDKMGVTFDRRKGSSPFFFFFLTKNEQQQQNSSQIG